MMLEQLIIPTDACTALQGLGPYQLIDDISLDDIQYTVEAMPGLLKNQPFIRLRVSRKGKSRRDSFSRSLVWPVANAENPVELAVLARIILGGTLAIRPRRDPRKLSLRLRDYLSRIRLINHIEEVASVKVPGLGRIRLSATVFENAQHHELATIYQHRTHRRRIALTLPMSSVAKVQQWALCTKAHH
ncbi:hypothetical protein IMCC21906_02589 [Spongiibacter sp. IMCC21906]|jgi:hypothetical protein|uniref:hypothetical protein n=1 Tax=Spongiibacter sp. IMCC21906 TaxID=1620392 RepID=UPI00062DCB14|nr:hypothetical protein [Spongiibacter sp. IMCC21906]AKH70234.1 hypothetical protein IMCC21906_02589 [Spongiibacter sp. IMCC21906]